MGNILEFIFSMGEKIKVFAGSDIHGVAHWSANLAPMPEVDLALFAGDLTDLPSSFKYYHLPESTRHRARCTEQKLEWANFVNNTAPRLFPNAKIVILPGNHDTFVCKSSDKCVYVMLDAFNFLELTIKHRKIRIGGVPGITYDALFRGTGKSCPPYRNRLSSEAEMLANLSKLPQNLDILLTHVPPIGKFSMTDDGFDVGSKALAYAAETILDKCRYFIFGHNHHPGRELTFNSERNPQYFFNVAAQTYGNTGYEPPFIFEYEPRQSRVRAKRAFNRWGFWRLYHRRLHAKLSSGHEWCMPCPHCGAGVIPTDGAFNEGCTRCVESEYLSKLRVSNFDSDEFKYWESAYQARMRAK